MAHIQPRTLPKTRRRPKTVRRFDVVWREQGRERSRTFVLRRDAERFKVELGRRSQLGPLYEAPPITLAEARASWLGRWQIGKAASTIARKEEAWPHVAALDGTPLVALTPMLLEDTVARAARVAPRQAQLALGQVKQILRDAQGRGQRVDPKVLDVRAPSYEEREPVFLTYPEVQLLASWCAEGRLVEFLALSGLRIGEALALRDTEVDLSARTVLVMRATRKGREGKTKTRKRRRLDLCDAAMQVVREQLMARRPNPLGLVFPSPRADVAWNSDNFRADVFAPAVRRFAFKVRAGRRADAGRVVLHDLRHTFASLMVAAKANPLDIALALGHTDAKGRPDATLVWKRYGHLYDGSMRVAADRLDAHLEALAS